MTKEVCIIGSNGIIGSFLEENLNDFFKINLISKSQNPNKKNFFKLNLLDKEEIKKYVKNLKIFDTIIFLVGHAHKSGKKSDFEMLNYWSVRFFFDILKSERKLPKKIIFSSTISIYGEDYNKKYFNEDTLKNPLSHYARSKLLAEEYLIKNFSERLWIMRIAPVYSNQFLLNINKRIKFSTIYYKISQGEKLLSLCNIKNIKVLILEIINDCVPPDIYNISDSVDYSYKNLHDTYGKRPALSIPYILIFLLFKFGEFSKNIFLTENCIKLLTSNIYSSKKVRKFIKLPYSIYSK